MSAPRVLIGHDHVLVECLFITPTPSTDPVAPVNRDYGVSGKHHDQGRFAVWRWSHVDGEDEYLDILVQLGLDDADTCEVTIYTKNERMIWTLYNAIAHLPEMGSDVKYQNFFPRDIAVYFTDLEEIEEF
jgi:hypothetical protein